LDKKSQRRVTKPSRIVVLFRRVRKIAKGDYSFRHVCLYVRPSVRLEKLGSHRTDFH